MNLTYVAIAVVIAMVVSTLFYFLKRWQIRRLNALLLAKRYDLFEQMLNSFLSSLLFSKFARKSYELNESFLRNDRKRTDQLFEELIQARMSYNTREKLLMQAFNYYLNAKDYKKTTQYYEEIQKLPNVQMKEETSIMYDIYIQKGDKYLDFLLDRISQNDDVYNGVDEFLVSVIYENKGDKANAKKYEKLSREHMQLLDHEIAQRSKNKK